MDKNGKKNKKSCICLSLGGVFFSLVLSFSPVNSQAKNILTIQALHSNPLAPGMESVVRFSSPGLAKENNTTFMYVKMRCRDNSGRYTTCGRGFNDQMRFMYKALNWDDKKGLYTVDVPKSIIPASFYSRLSKTINSTDPRLSSSELRILLGKPKKISKPNESFREEDWAELVIEKNTKLRKVQSRIEIDLDKLPLGALEAVGAVVVDPPDHTPPWERKKRPPWDIFNKLYSDSLNAPIEGSGHIREIRFR